MLRWLAPFTVGLALGATIVAAASSSREAVTPQASSSTIVELRLYTVDKGRLDDFAVAWQAGVYPLRLKMGFRIPFAAKIPDTNQFIWLLTYDGAESWENKQKAYYGSPERKGLSPDPAQWIARPEHWLIKPVVGLSSRGN